MANRRILVVDDQPSIRGVLELALTDAGAEVQAAEDGAAALRTIADGPPDLILLDLAMPGLSGWDVLQRLAARPDAVAVPVVLETSAEDLGSFTRARKLGVAAFISKPFRLHEVIETCRRVLDGARPFQGTTPQDETAPGVEVRDASNTLIADGRLVDVAGRGAQVELGTSLVLGQVVRLKIQGGGEARTAEIRWVTRVGDRYYHGVYFPSE